MDEEMRAHLALRAERNRAAGMEPREAEQAALRSFGEVDRIKEKCRAARADTAVRRFIAVIRRSVGR